MDLVLAGSEKMRGLEGIEYTFNAKQKIEDNGKKLVRLYDEES